VITIGQLARYAGVSTKTVRVYHAKGLLPEPERDASGYRRYTARNAIELIRIRTLAAAGVPLARIREFLDAPPPQVRRGIDQVDRDLTARIEALTEARHRLRRLADGHLDPLLPQVVELLEGLADLGFSRRWIELQTDVWILVCATHPEQALDLVHDQTQALTDPALRQLYLDYDRLYDVDPDDERVEHLARRIGAATRQRYGDGVLPGQDTGSEVPALIQTVVNDSSAAWRRLDTLIRTDLGL